MSTGTPCRRGSGPARRHIDRRAGGRHAGGLRAGDLGDLHASVPPRADRAGLAGLRLGHQPGRAADAPAHRAYAGVKICIYLAYEAARTEDPDRDQTGRRPYLGRPSRALVRGPASKYPRGFLWLIPRLVHHSGRSRAGRVHESAAGCPCGWAATEIGGIALAGNHPVLRAGDRQAARVPGQQPRHRARLPHHAQAAEAAPGHYLPWPDIAQVRMAPPSTGCCWRSGSPRRPGSRTGRARRAGAAPARRARHAVRLRPRPSGPDSRRAPIRPGTWSASATCGRADLRQVLTAVKPPPIAVRVLTKPGPLRYPSAARPGTAVPLTTADPGVPVSAAAPH